MTKFYKTLKTATFALAFGAIAAQTAQAQTVFGITTDDKLVSFQANLPATVTTPVTITGLSAGHIIVGGDFRPATGQYFILSRKASADSTQLYTLNTVTGAATKVGTGSLALGSNQVGFDFNPAVDRIRVVSATGKNFRISPATGTGATDGALAYATGDVNFGKPARVGSIAYTNSFIGTTGTMLFDYDDSLNVLSLQSPPNAGGLVTRGNTGLKQNYTNDITSDMDIAYNTANGANTAYLMVNGGTSSKDTLYTINISTGAVTVVGALGDPVNGIALKDIAVQIAAPAAVTGNNTFYGLQWNALDAVTKLPAANMLVTFGSTSLNLGFQRQISGLKAGFNIVGMDIRPNGNGLYALAVKASGDSALIYTINPATAAATVVKDSAIFVGVDSIYRANIGFDFNPTVDRIRVTSSNGVNLRLHPVTGAVAFKDANFTYKAGDVNAAFTPTLGSCAYTNSLGSSMGKTTKLYYFDEVLNVFDTTNTPNTGVVGTFATSTVKTGANKSVDLDIFTNKTTAANTAYFVGNNAAFANDSLYTFDLTNGSLTLIGKIGSNSTGVAIKDIAVVIDTAVATVGVNNKVTNTGAIKLYPNPTSNVANLNVVMNANTYATITITDILGRTVQTVANNQLLVKGDNNFEVNLSNEANGTYYIVVAAEGISATKIVKQ